jgi:hypothetical protein
MRKSLVYAFVSWDAGGAGGKAGKRGAGAEVLFVKAYRAGFD